MHDTKERLSRFWIFALLNYLHADVIALFDIAGSRNSFEPLTGGVFLQEHSSTDPMSAFATVK